jgi:hypothetical protein
MGFEYQALACQELVVGRQLPYLRSCVSVLKDNCVDVTLLSCSHPHLFEKFKMADHFVGMSWFNQAFRGRRLGAGLELIGTPSNGGIAERARENLVRTVDAL